MKRPLTMAAVLAGAAALAACEATMIQQQLHYGESQGVGFTIDHEEDSFLGGAQIVHRAHNSNPFPVCARLVGRPWVLVPAGQTVVLATASPPLRDGEHRAKAPDAGGRCS